MVEHVNIVAVKAQTFAAALQALAEQRWPPDLALGKHSGAFCTSVCSSHMAKNSCL